MSEEGGEGELNRLAALLVGITALGRDGRRGAAGGGLSWGRDGGLLYFSVGEAF